jgi:hypothetical protein
MPNQRKDLLGEMSTMKDEEAAGLRDILLLYWVKIKIGGQLTSTPHHK